MELYEEIICRAKEMNSTISFTEGEFVEGECYKMLKKIQQILSSEQWDDAECFWKIEKIVAAFEESGMSAGGRHDF